jgi:predicted hydrolase (HD superfamily)
MKMRFRYGYDWLQERLIKHLKEETEAKFRIQADRTIEFAKKWYPTVDEQANEIRFEIFVKPLCRTWNEDLWGVIFGYSLPVVHQFTYDWDTWIENQKRKNR